MAVAVMEYALDNISACAMDRVYRICGVALLCEDGHVTWSFKEEGE